MARGVRVKLNAAGFKALRSDPAVMEVLDETAADVMDRANADPSFPMGFSRTQHPGGSRGRVTVFSDDINGILAEAKHGALSKARGV